MNDKDNLSQINIPIKILGMSSIDKKLFGVQKSYPVGIIFILKVLYKI